MLLKPNEVDAPDLFGREGSLVLEAGFGDGSFMVHLARTHPTWNLLGADVSRGSVSRAYRRLRRAGVKHARLFLGKAEFLVRNVVQEGGLHRLYVNFPDPWPKLRHRDRRLLNRPFLALLSTRLAPGGALLFTTDDRAYYEAAIEDAQLAGLYEVSTPAPLKAMLQTKYANKWNTLDRHIYHLRLTKIAANPAAFPRTVTRIAMHHVLLNGELPSLTAFVPFRRSFSAGQVVVTGALHRVGDSGLLFEVRVQEDDLTQDVLVEAKPARAAYADVIVSVSTFGQPLATRGTREAVKAIEQWLTGGGMQTAETYY